jgi:hypothetical protein
MQGFSLYFGKIKYVYFKISKLFEQERIGKPKYLFIGLAVAIVLACTIFIVPLKDVPYEVEYTYYDTEINKEPYTVIEPFITEQLNEKTRILFNDFRIVVPAGVNVPFTIDKPNARLTGSFENSVPGGFYIYSFVNHIVFEKLGDRGNFEISLPEGNYRALFRENLLWSEHVYIFLAMKWSEIDNVTKYREVTRYREIPVEVEKKAAVIEYDKVSMWKFIFGY